MDTAKGSFGFRGEALGSISDASLLEVVTKAHGRPNGYRKVMKGCKCLYLGIDDDRQDVGTTVIARDLFYNQPVRRKHMQSSPKKALHSVKNCVLLIALVHTQVSFKVVDVESEEELLYTQSSSSPLSLLRNAFGIEVSSSLRELNLSDGIIKLSGYMSSPSSTVSVKAFQYVYINSRIVCKCPIHKLLNQLASRFRCLDPLKIENAVQNRKNRSLAHPSYILNFSCPWSYYDLTFEPSKTSVAFKDWSPILKFIEGSIIQFWSGEMGLGKSSGYASDISRKDESWEEVDNIVSAAEDFSKKSETAEKLWKIKNQQASIGRSSTPVEMLTRECHMPDWKDDRILCQLDKKTAEFNEQQTESVHRTECSFKLWDTSPPKCISMANQESDIHHWTFDNDVFSAENNSFENDFTATERFNDYVNSFLGSSWGEEPLEVDHSMSNGSTETALSYDCFELSNVVEVGKELKKPFLQSCSSRENRQPDGGFVRDERCEIQSDGLRTKRKRVDPDDKVNVVEVDESRRSIDFLSDGLRTKRKWLDPNVMVNVAEADESSQSIDFFSRSLLQCEPESGPSSLWQGKAAGRPSPRFRKEDNMYTQSTDLDFFSRDSLKLFSIDRTQSTDLDFFSRDSLKLFSLDRKRFAEEDDFPPNSVTEIGSGYPPLNSEWEPVTLEPLVKSTCWDVEHFNHENALEGCLRSGRYEDFANYDSMPNSSNQGNCSSSCTNNDLDIKGYAAPKREFFKFLKGRNRVDSFCSRDSDVLTEEPDWPCLDTCSKDNTDNFALSFYRVPSFSYIDKDDHRWELHKNQDSGQLAHKERSMRSCSAPPFYRGKKKVLTLNDRLSLKGGITSARVIHEASTLLETSEFKRSQQSFGAHQLHLKTAFVEDSLLEDKSNMKKRKYARPDVNEIQEGEEFNKPQSPHIHDTELSKDFISTEIHHSIDTWSKWRNSCSQGANGDESDKFHHQCDILDISSGILHLAGDSLVPESISKRCLEDAKVLQQVDKKFIPIVATGTLAIIDQHAADERIRLEELRQKVLSGQAKTINYLDSEQELVLPEIAYQLLHNYTEQIQNWGWICNIHDQGVESFTKNLNLLHRRPTVVTLLAVPCILGVNLTDVDLLEYLQQLADTDGSSTMPPSVLRILNFKACRGAIMFGDSLLPSECSLIVEELKRTSLCFQCAHGRPTTIPLVKLEDLHKQIVKVGLLNDASNQAWHGLVRQEICLDRATQRLKLARG